MHTMSLAFPRQSSTERRDPDPHAGPDEAWATNPPLISQPIVSVFSLPRYILRPCAAFRWLGVSVRGLRLVFRV